MIHCNMISKLGEPNYPKPLGPGPFWLARYNWPHSFSCAARCLKRQLLNKCYIQLSQLHPMRAKFQYVTNIETCTLLSCNHKELVKYNIWYRYTQSFIEITRKCMRLTKFGWTDRLCKRYKAVWNWVHGILFSFQETVQKLLQQSFKDEKTKGK